MAGSTTQASQAGEMNAGDESFSSLVRHGPHTGWHCQLPERVSSPYLDLS